jgi:hypothetical protein
MMDSGKLSKKQTKQNPQLNFFGRCTKRCTKKIASLKPVQALALQRVGCS